MFNVKVFKSEVKQRIEKKDFKGLDQLLAKQPSLANRGITIPFDMFCRTKAHPLHRVCDAVFAQKITDEEALRFAKVFLAHGADIDGDKQNGGGTPLLASASLHAEQTGIFYIENGADVNYRYKRDGASALHWASFCGRDKLVNKLIRAHAVIDQPDDEFNSTPLGWALYALSTNDKLNAHNQVDCVKLLLRAESDIKKLPEQSICQLKALAEEDFELKKLI